jgi:hypothetical protein
MYSTIIKADAANSLDTKFILPEANDLNSAGKSL